MHLQYLELIVPSHACVSAHVVTAAAVSHHGVSLSFPSLFPLELTVLENLKAEIVHFPSQIKECDWIFNILV